MLVELFHKQANERKPLENWHEKQHILSVAVNQYHTKFSNIAELDLNDNSGSLTDLAKKIAQNGGFTHPPGISLLITTITKFSNLIGS